jgi:hypothetical protein
MAGPVNLPVVVQTKSAWKSKTNRIAAGTAAAAFITALTPLFPPKYQPVATAFVALLGSLGIGYVKTYQTDTVTPSSINPNDALETVMRAAGAGEVQITQALNTRALAAAKQ